jgi:hypothetical protein
MGGGGGEGKELLSTVKIRPLCYFSYFMKKKKVRAYIGANPDYL